MATDLAPFLADMRVARNDLNNAVNKFRAQSGHLHDDLRNERQAVTLRIMRMLIAIDDQIAELDRLLRSAS